MSITTLVTRQRVCAAKLETTQGTAIALAAADGTTPFQDPKLSYDIPFNKRPSPGSASYFPGVPGPRKGTLTGQTYLYNSGSGTAPVWMTTWMAACGMSITTGVATPVTGSSSASTVTAGLYQDGRLKTIVGAAGNFVIKGTSGNPCTIDWTLTGKWAAPSATALIAPTYDTAIPPRFASATVTIGGTSYKVSEFSLDPGNKVALVEDANDVTGYAWALVTDRDPKLTVKLMATTAKDFYADYVAGTTAAFSCAVGSGTNNIITIAAPVAQLMQTPDDEDNEGYLVDSLTFALCKSAAAGDDEFSITAS